MDDFPSYTSSFIGDFSVFDYRRVLDDTWRHHPSVFVQVSLPVTTSMKQLAHTMCEGAVAILPEPAQFLLGASGPGPHWTPLGIAIVFSVISVPSFAHSPTPGRKIGTFLPAMSQNYASGYQWLVKSASASPVKAIDSYPYPY